MEKEKFLLKLGGSVHLKPWTEPRCSGTLGSAPCPCCSRLSVCATFSPFFSRCRSSSPAGSPQPPTARAQPTTTAVTNPTALRPELRPAPMRARAALKVAPASDRASGPETVMKVQHRAALTAHCLTRRAVGDAGAIFLLCTDHTASL